MTPYYQDDLVTIYHGDCREVMATLSDDSADVVMADPPYGVGKAEWDTEFPTDWMTEAARIAPVLGLMPGIWNLLGCPPSAGRLDYRWTFAAHLANGTGRGALGLADWIPCLVYMADEAPAWCRLFADWCADQGITRADLDATAGTSDMGGWWISRLAHRCQVPARWQWQKIRIAFSPPVSFDILVDAVDPFVDAGSTSRTFSLGREPKADHPSPKPIDVMAWFLARMPGYRLPGRFVLDPFMGSGTTLVAAKATGRRAIGIEIEERYCEIAAQRCSQEVLGLAV